MALLIVLLISTSLWLWLFDGARRAFDRSRVEGGKLLFAFPTAYKNRHFHIAALLLIIFLIQLLPLVRRNISDDAFDLLRILYITIILFNLFPPPWYMIAFEVHEKGVVAGGLFAPWSEILYFRKLPSRGTVEIQFRQFWKEFRVDEDFREAAASALRSHVEERSECGIVVSSPLRSKPPAETPSGAVNLRRKRFQFDLRSLLLFFLFAATLGSWLGIRYRRWDFQAKALAELKAFAPKVSRAFFDVDALDFSQSPRQPVDDDLAKIEKFTGLKRLDLAGAPITDAGLGHLLALPNLELVNLNNTQITYHGYSKLHQAKPTLIILWTPPSPPPHPPRPPWSQLSTPSQPKSSSP